MYTVPTIPGVTLAVYKQNRQITPESDGYVGRLYSGSVTILAVIDPCADKTIGLFRDGQDHYIQQKELLSIPELRHGRFPPKPAQQFMRGLLNDLSLASGSQAYGITMPLRVFAYEGQPVNTVHYPENMLVLAQYVRNAGQPTDRVHVWKVALVSQNGEFFLTVQQAYDTTAHQSSKNTLCFPRFQAHRLLERVLVANAPVDLPVTSEGQFIRPEPLVVNGLKEDEGVVERWYPARNMGCVITASGSARVHWSDVPPRPRLRFLVEGEHVRIGALGIPPQNPRTDRRTVRKSRFALQASGIELG